MFSKNSKIGTGRAGLRENLASSLQTAYKDGGLAEAEKLLRQARGVYAGVVAQIAIPEDWHKPAQRAPDKPPTLWTRDPAREWDVYIDETGVRFSEQGSGAEGAAAKIPDGNLPCRGAEGCPNADAALVRSSVKEALCVSIADAAEQWGRAPVDGSLYPHYLLARYLAYTGTDEERKPYMHRSDLWTDAEKGFGSGHPWPQIQYFRWLMVDTDDVDLRRELAYSLEQARGKDNMPTVELIGLAIAISMNVRQPAGHAVRAKLLQLEAQLSDVGC